MIYIKNYILLFINILNNFFNLFIIQEISTSEI